MQTILLFTVLAVAVPVRPDIGPKEEVKPVNQLLGDWEVTGFSLFGQDDKGADDVIGMIMRFTPAEIQVTKKGQRQPNDDATYTINWTRMPAAIDFMPKGQAGRAEAKIEGILKIEGDLLTMCFAIALNAEVVRPSGFAPAPNGMTAVIRMRRVAKR